METTIYTYSEEFKTNLYSDVICQSLSKPLDAIRVLGIKFGQFCSNHISRLRKINE